MRFTHNGVTYLLEFERQHKHVHLPQTSNMDAAGLKVVNIRKSTYPYTTLNIRIEGRPKGEAPFRSVTVGAHHREVYSKAAGRFNAMKLMSKGNSLSTAFKAAMWDAYRRACSNPFAK